MLKSGRCDSDVFPDTGGGSDYSDSEFRPIRAPKQISETSTKRATIGNDDILIAGFSSDDESTESPACSQNESLASENSDSSSKQEDNSDSFTEPEDNSDISEKQDDNSNSSSKQEDNSDSSAKQDDKSDSLAKRNERMSDEWWKDPNKPKVESVQTIENSKVMEVRVLPPQEFLDRMESEEDETSRRDRSLTSSNLSKQDRSLKVEEPEKPKLTRELLLKILSSFRTSKSSRLAKILADQNIQIELGNLKANIVITELVFLYSLYFFYQFANLIVRYTLLFRRFREDFFFA